MGSDGVVSELASGDALGNIDRPAGSNDIFVIRPWVLFGRTRRLLVRFVSILVFAIKDEVIVITVIDTLRPGLAPVITRLELSFVDTMESMSADCSSRENNELHILIINFIF